MLAFGQGQDSAFDSLFSRWSGPLLHYLHRMMGNMAVAEELVQETFLRVYRARGRFEPKARFSTWLYRIGTNLALNEMRRPAQRKTHASVDGIGDGTARFSEPGNDSVVLVSSEFDNEQRLALQERGRLVADVLETLPERQRAALWLSSVEGLSYAEVAEVLVISEAAVKSLIFRARSALLERVPLE